MKRPLLLLLVLIAVGAVATGVYGVFDWRDKGTTTISSTVTFQAPADPVVITNLTVNVEDDEVLAGVAVYAGPEELARPGSLFDLRGILGQVSVTGVGGRTATLSRAELAPWEDGPYAVVLVVSYWDKLLFFTRRHSEVRVFHVRAPSMGMIVAPDQDDYVVLDDID
jgi:hypothetical protein